MTILLSEIESTVYIAKYQVGHKTSTDYFPRLFPGQRGGCKRQAVYTVCLLKCLHEIFPTRPFSFCVPP